MMYYVLGFIALVAYANWRGRALIGGEYLAIAMFLFLGLAHLYDGLFHCTGVSGAGGITQ